MVLQLTEQPLEVLAERARAGGAGALRPGVANLADLLLQLVTAVAVVLQLRLRVLPVAHPGGLTLLQFGVELLHLDLQLQKLGGVALQQLGRLRDLRHPLARAGQLRRQLFHLLA